ncbi:MAG TPA: fibronectin type III domain-containing protein [Longimicrobiales bacterium]|nr:fibronectin type III domain-containing protein [Longimicrobiales bacterium]
MGAWCEAMDDMEIMGAPERVAGLVAESAGGGNVSLRWSPPAGRVPHTRFFVVCLREGTSGRERLVATRFLPARQRVHVEAGLAPGRYRFEVGALGPTGSGRRERVVVKVDRTGAVHVVDREGAPGLVGRSE